MTQPFRSHLLHPLEDIRSWYSSYSSLPFLSVPLSQLDSSRLIFYSSYIFYFYCRNICVCPLNLYAAISLLFDLRQMQGKTFGYPLLYNISLMPALHSSCQKCVWSTVGFYPKIKLYVYKNVLPDSFEWAGKTRKMLYMQLIYPVHVQYMYLQLYHWTETTKIPKLKY